MNVRLISLHQEIPVWVMEKGHLSLDNSNTAVHLTFAIDCQYTRWKETR